MAEFTVGTAPWSRYSTGAERKEAALRALEALRAEALTHVRARLEGLYLERRCQGTYAQVTADDAARILTDLTLLETRYAHLPRTFLGCVFRDGRWRKTGHMIQSSQPRNHCRLLHAWALVGDLATRPIATGVEG